MSTIIFAYSTFVIFLTLNVSILAAEEFQPRNASLSDFPENTAGKDRPSGRILNMFSVVRFPNGICVSKSAKNGTCYAAEECSDRSGVASGECAAGYGVCCVFEITCGRTTSENCTYFTSTGGESGACRVRICPCSDDICQMRLDFSSFVINGPSTSATTVAKINAAVEVTDTTQCLIDQFTVTAPGNTPPPVICGTNTGEHMYFDASDQCNDLTFNLGNDGTLANRAWNIKITQYDCDYENLAPDGCTQYFFDTTSDIVKTYNFDGGVHLADQDQNICIRRERGMCRICWATIAEGDFETSTAMTEATGQGKMTTKCCGYGTDAADNAVGFDCALIPGATRDAAAGDRTALKGAGNGFCGGELGTASNIAAATICSSRTPFSVRFISDHYDYAGERNAAGDLPNGFRLIYDQRSC